MAWKGKEKRRGWARSALLEMWHTISQYHDKEASLITIEPIIALLSN